MFDVKILLLAGFCTKKYVCMLVKACLILDADIHLC